jgi:CheY-like chemotaxis protein/KaiC/GvpD/RAD55 family RecA-like ATPase
MSKTGTDAPVVLVVDDDEEIIETYDLWLGEEYRLRTATDGETALARLDEDVDVVLLDRLMPGMSGEEVLAAIRDRGIDCRVAMVTAVEPDEEVAEMPFDAYVTKALEREDVRQTIERLVARSEADEVVREHYAVAEKLAALEEGLTDIELADSAEYQQLRERFETLDARLSSTSVDRDGLVNVMSELEPAATADPGTGGEERPKTDHSPGPATDPDPDPDAYDLLDWSDADAVRPVAPGTTLLVAAPMTVGQEFLAQSLEYGLARSEGGLVIATDDSAAAVVPAVDASTEHLKVVDCRSDASGFDARGNVVVQDVDTPRNLTDIGIGFTNAVGEFEEMGVDRARCGLLSLSVILSYVDQETAYRLCQTLSRGLAEEGFVGLFLLDRNAHDQQTEQTLRRAFDGLIDSRRIEDGDETEHELRVLGVGGVPSDWVRL